MIGLIAALLSCALAQDFGIVAKLTTSTLETLLPSLIQRAFTRYSYRDNVYTLSQMVVSNVGFGDFSNTTQVDLWQNNGTYEVAIPSAEVVLNFDVIDEDRMFNAIVWLDQLHTSF